MIVTFPLLKKTKSTMRIIRKPKLLWTRIHQNRHLFKVKSLCRKRKFINFFILCFSLSLLNKSIFIYLHIIFQFIMFVFVFVLLRIFYIKFLCITKIFDIDIRHISFDLHWNNDFDRTASNLMKVIHNCHIK